MPKPEFIISDTEHWDDGRVCHHSTAYVAMQAFDSARHEVEYAVAEKRKADIAAQLAQAAYKAALYALENELIALYGDDMPEAFEMSGGVLVFDDEHGPRYLKSRSYADTYRIEKDADKEAA